MQQVADRSSHDTTRADAKQRFRSAIQKCDDEPFVEYDERGGDALKNRVRRRRASQFARRAEGLGRRR
jgi:hypothetical protein